MLTAGEAHFHSSGPFRRAQPSGYRGDGPQQRSPQGNGVRQTPSCLDGRQLKQDENPRTNQLTEFVVVFGGQQSSAQFPQHFGGEFESLLQVVVILKKQET